jgi:hypothetical protein
VRDLGGLGEVDLHDLSRARTRSNTSFAGTGRHRACVEGALRPLYFFQPRAVGIGIDGAIEFLE